MSPLGVILNIAIIVGIVGIIVYWVRRFAVFRGYKDIQSDVLRVAEFLRSQPTREGNDVVVAGYLGWLPTIVRFSKKLDTPGLHIEMRVPANFGLTIMPKTVALPGEGRVVMRTGSAMLDKRFTARSDEPLEVRMVLGTQEALHSLEQLCCSTQTALSIKNHTMELSELAIPSFPGNHVLDHLNSMNVLAGRIREMPGASEIRLKRLPETGSGWTIRIALSLGLICLVALLFVQPANRRAAQFNPNAVIPEIPPADASRMQQLQGWHLAKADDFSDSAVRFLREHNLPLSGRLTADFAGRGNVSDSVYLLVNSQGSRRVSMLAGGAPAYDAIFPRLDALARIPKASMGKIKWKTAPQFESDGDALLVIQNTDDPTASLVLLRHGTQTYSAQPADYSQIDLATQ